MNMIKKSLASAAILLCSTAAASADPIKVGVSLYGL